MSQRSKTRQHAMPNIAHGLMAMRVLLPVAGTQTTARLPGCADPSTRDSVVSPLPFRGSAAAPQGNRDALWFWAEDGAGTAAHTPI